MSNTTISGSARQSHKTAQGLSLERGYIYLTPELWQALYAASRAAGLSASQQIATLISAADGKSIKESNNVQSCPRH